MFERPVAAAALLLITAVASAAEIYPLGPDSQRNPDVPRGAVSHYTWTSKIFPGTVRDYWVYVPAQYDAARPACVMVFQDGGGYVNEESRWRVPIVFDNLIAKRDTEGRTALIIANPPGGRATSMAWGGADLQTMYVAAGGELYRRHVLHKGT